MKVKIDIEKCHKSGECYYNHPELFKMGEEGYSMVLVEDFDDRETLKHAEQAIEVCPAEAISLED